MSAAAVPALPAADGRLSVRQVIAFWAPVAFMWLMMSLEQPLVAAAVARLPDPRVNLAAFGLTFSLALIIESPVIMLLTAATALARDRKTYRRLLVFTASLALIVAAVHVTVASTSLFERVVRGAIGAPPELVAPGRMALLLMFAWSPAIAFRRLWHGVMIRHDRPRSVGLTTVVRLSTIGVACVLGVAYGGVPGAWLGGAALGAAVTVEAVAARWLVGPTLRSRLSTDRADVPALSWRHLATFYAPLALTSFIVLGSQPIVSFGLARSPDSLQALAVWPVVMGLSFLFRGSAYGFQEVVVALHDRPGGIAALRRAGWVLAVGLGMGLALVAWTPVADLWLVRVTGLQPDLVAAARQPLRLLAAVPALSMAISWYRGRLVATGRTRAITAAVAVNLVALAAALAVALARLPAGAVAAAVAVEVSLLAEAGALAVMSRRLPDGA